MISWLCCGSLFAFHFLVWDSDGNTTIDRQLKSFKFPANPPPAQKKGGWRKRSSFFRKNPLQRDHSKKSESFSVMAVMSENFFKKIR